MPGHISEAFSTTVLPQASGIATARVPRMTGAFHGAMPTQTPAAWRMPMASVPGLSEGMTSPVICVVIDAASRSIFAASITLNPAQGAVAPVSSIIRRVNSSTLEASTSAAFISSVRRSPGPVFDHAGKAAAAAATAASTSARPPAGARVAVLPVNGSWRSNEPPSAAGRSAPSIKSPISMETSLLLSGDRSRRKQKSRSREPRR